MAAPLNDQTRSNVEKPKEANRRRGLPARKKILFSIMITAALFAAMELLLAAFGVRPITYNEDPFVGFTSRSPLFEEVQSPDGESGNNHGVVLHAAQGARFAEACLQPCTQAIAGPGP